MTNHLLILLAGIVSSYLIIEVVKRVSTLLHKKKAIEIPKVGEIWNLCDRSPWTAITAEILNVKGGCVLYRLFANGVAWHMKVKDFIRIYNKGECVSKDCLEKHGAHQ